MSGLPFEKDSVSVSRLKINQSASPFEIVRNEQFERYQGSIINCKLNGVGKMYSQNNKLIYSGGFLDNHFDGYGKLFNLTPKESQKSDRNIVDNNKKGGDLNNLSVVGLSEKDWV